MPKAEGDLKEEEVEKWGKKRGWGGGGEKKKNKDFDNEDDGGEEVEETISSEVAWGEGRAL